ncbi:MAG: tetratricopeptide repeat-containing sensor histidine kinase [Ignavibacteriae bacterium]|nr:tetratricopeptide repeat-containing sensor histidine kinase [Ignavibacteriota bacterium]
MKYSAVIIFFLLVLFLCNEKSFSQADTAKVKELINTATDRSRGLEESARIIEEAISLSQKINFPQGEADALNKKGSINLRMGEYKVALEAFWKELNLRESNPGWENSSVSNVYAYIGESYRAIGSYDLSEEYLNKSLKLAQKNNNIKDIAYAFNRLASVYHELSYRKPDTSYSYKAVEYSNKSLELYGQMNNPANIINNYNIIGAAYHFQGRYDESLKYLFLALDYTDKDTSNSDKPNILNNIASLYNVKKEFDKAIYYASLSYSISKKSGIKIYLVGAARQLTTAYAGTGDYKNAFRYLEEAANLSTGLFDDKKTSEIYGLQKEHELDLSTREEELKTTRLKILGTAVFVVILLIGTGLYLRHRQLISVNSTLEKSNELISAQKEELAKSNADKDKFISILSHDIRNPLNGILGLTDILERDYEKIDEKERREFLGYLNTSAKSLFRLVDRVLLWSRLQRGNFQIKKERINLKEIAMVAVGLQKPNAIKKGIILENNISEDIFTESDRNVLDTVIRNLLDNAVKFTNAGGRVILESGFKNNKIIICITDTGIGIETEDIEKLFGIEYKISTKGTANEEGTGLGLTLCRDMLLLVGSDLKAESEKGGGSKFYFELPAL